MEHSCSPQMNNAALAEMGLDWCYLAFRVESEHLEEVIKAAAALGLRGLNVTIPHKQTIVKYLDEITPDAQFVGAVNTIQVAPGRLVGWNTDVERFLRNLQEEGVDVKGARVLILGAGGAAKAVGIAVLKAEAERIWVANRTVPAAHRLADFLNERAGRELATALPLTVEALKTLAGGPNVVINCSSLGMAPNVREEPPLPWQELTGLTLAVDVVYNPPFTSFLRSAAQKGLKTINGVGMLVHQGAMALEIWTGRKPPLDVMRRALLEALQP